MAREHDVAQVRRAVAQKFAAQRPHADPGAGGQLEILRDAPIENESFAGILGSTNTQRIAQAIESFLIEHGARQFGLAPVAGSDAGTAQPGFHFLAGLHQLQLDARRGQADVPGAIFSQ